MGPGQTTTEPRQNLFEIGKKFREFRILVFGPIPQGQNAELDFAEKKFREFRVLVFGPIPQGQNAELDFAELVCQHKKLFSR